MGNPLASLLALLGSGTTGPQQPPSNLPMSPVAGKLAALSGMQQQPQMSAATPPFTPQPQGQSVPPQAGMGGGGDVVGGLMKAAQAAMSNPAAQPVPTFNTGADLSNHPNLASIINALSQGASAYGWTAMAPQERLQRMQMEQQKAEAMSQLAANQEYRQSELGIRDQMAKATQENAETKAAAQRSLEEHQRETEQYNRDLLETRKSLGEANIAIRQGHLAQGQEIIDQKASQFEQKFKLAVQKYGLDQAKVMLQQEGNDIKKGFLGVAQGMLNQRGTVEGAQIQEKLKQSELDHPFYWDVFGMGTDLQDMVRQSQAAPIPGTGAAQTIPGSTQGGVTPRAGVAAPTPKKKAAAPSGATHVYVPGQGIQPIGND